MLLLCFLLQAAHAAAVSRLGGLFFYDPLTFDAGLLQQGLSVRGGAGGEAGLLTVGGEVPFYRELSVRVGYQQEMRYGLDNAHRLTWRLRAPVIQSLRYASVRTWQFYYIGGLALSDAVSPHDPTHEAGGARADARTPWARAVLDRRRAAGRRPGPGHRAHGVAPGGGGGSAGWYRDSRGPDASERASGGEGHPGPNPD